MTSYYTSSQLPLTYGSMKVKIYFSCLLVINLYAVEVGVEWHYGVIVTAYAVIRMLAYETELWPN